MGNDKENTGERQCNIKNHGIFLQSGGTIGIIIWIRIIDSNQLYDTKTQHHRISRSITNIHIHPDINDPTEWIYPDMGIVLEK